MNISEKTLRITKSTKEVVVSIDSVAIAQTYWTGRRSKNTVLDIQAVFFVFFMSYNKDNKNELQNVNNAESASLTVKNYINQTSRSGRNVGFKASIDIKTNLRHFIL